MGCRSGLATALTNIYRIKNGRGGQGRKEEEKKEERIRETGEDLELATLRPTLGVNFTELPGRV